MGILGTILSGARTGLGMLSNPGVQDAIQYLQARHMGIDPITAQAQQEQMAQDAERTRLWREQQARQQAKWQQDQADRQTAEKNQTATNAVISAYSDPRYKAIVDANPQVFKSYLSGMGGQKQGLDSGLPVGEPKPFGADREKMGVITEGGVKYYVERGPDGQLIKTPLGAVDATEAQQNLPASLQEMSWLSDPSRTKEELDLYWKNKRAPIEPSSQAEQFAVKNMDQLLAAQAQSSRLSEVITGLESVPDDQWKAGVAGKLSEYAKSTFGVEDNVTLLRTLANEVRMSKSLGILPPGTASDKDVQLALSTTLPPTTNKQALLSWMRGAKKISDSKAQYHEFAAQHMQTDPVRGIFTVGPAWKAYNESGEVIVPKSSQAQAPQTRLVKDPQSGRWVRVQGQ